MPIATDRPDLVCSTPITHEKRCHYTWLLRRNSKRTCLHTIVHYRQAPAPCPAAALLSTAPHKSQRRRQRRQHSTGEASQLPAYPPRRVSSKSTTTGRCSFRWARDALEHTHLKGTLEGSKVAQRERVGFLERQRTCQDPRADWTWSP